MIGASLLNMLGNYEWPGNVRELRTAIERAIVLAGDSEYLTLECFPFLTARTLGTRQSLMEDIGQIERTRILDALEAARWNKSTAAKMLGMSRTTLNSRMERLAIPMQVPERFR